MTGLVVTAALWLALGAQPGGTRAQAAAHFERAELAFEAGRNEEAIREFEAAYALEAHPELLFNLGKCHERLGQLSAALRRYRAYVKALPTADDAELVLVAIAELERRVSELGPGAPAAALDAPRALLTPSRERGRVWTWVLVGAAGAGLATGVGLGLGAQSARDEMVRERHGAIEVQQLHDAAQGRALGANVAYGAAGAAALTALFLFFLEPATWAGAQR